MYLFMKNASAADLVEFGRWVRRWRKEFGYSQEELGEKVGVKKAYISNIENASPSSYTGEPTRPDIEIVDKLASAFQRPFKEARDLAGYGFPGPEPNTIEEVLDRDMYFDRKGLSESDREELRSVLKIADREVERLLSTQDRARPTKLLSSIIRSPIRHRDKIDEAIDAAQAFGGGPISEADRKKIREILENQSDDESS
jgi:transcriptional regulator with XRE-family HTH domain